MKRRLTVVFLSALLAFPAAAARRRSVAPVVADDLAILFVETAAADGTFIAAGGDAWLDVKEVAKTAGDHHTRVGRSFGIRIVRTSSSTAGTISITARLASTDGRTSMRLDGKPLTELPMVVDAHAVVGAVVMHRLDIEINDAVAPGAIAASIAWDVTAQ